MQRVNDYIRSLVSRIMRKHSLNRLVDEDFTYLINGRGNENKKGHVLKRIMLEYHVIEKGLTMPNRRLGFGEKVLLTLISDINTYMDMYREKHEQVEIAIKVVSEYNRVHNDASYPLKEDVQHAIDSVLKYDNPSDNCSQKSMSKDNFFFHVSAPFDVFSASRHSVRYFHGTVDIEKVKAAISLAQNAPSACNRQSTRVKIVTDKNLINKVFENQHGNRGFGQLADKLLVLTTDLQYWDIATYFGGYVDGGIYAMNLLYALHFHKIAACPLNANLSVEESRNVTRLLSIPESEKVFLFVAIGDVPDLFNLTNSHRTDSNSIITII